MTLSYEDQEALRYAKALLENPGLAAKITGLIGMPIEKALKLRPEPFTLTACDIGNRAQHNGGG